MRPVFFLVFFCACFFSRAGQLVLDGRYQGFNIYIQNPYASDSGFCTQQVLVNGKEIAFERASAYEIDLKSLGLQAGDSLHIVIEHKDDCMPKVMTYHQPRKSTFELTSIAVTPEGVLKWETKNETAKQVYIVEQFRWNKWVKVGEVDGQGLSGGNAYQCKILFHSGENQFRVKQIDYSGQPRISRAVKYTSAIPGIRFSVSDSTKEVIFSAETMYQLYDKYGNILKTGQGTTLPLAGIKRGVYFLNLDNRTEKLKWKVE